MRSGLFRSLPISYAFCLFVFLAVVPQAVRAEGDKEKADPACSLAKTNKNCSIVVDRTHPFSPPQLQMYPGAKVTVYVKNPRYYERYFLDYQSSQVTLTPDVLSSAVGPLLTPLAKLGEFHQKMKTMIAGDTTSCSPADITLNQLGNTSAVAANKDLFVSCFGRFENVARYLYSKIQLAAAPDAFSNQSGALATSDADAHNALEGINEEISQAVAFELALSGVVTQALKNAQSATPAQSAAGGGPPPAGQPQPPAYDNASLEALEQLNALRTVADAVATDLFAYSQRIGELPDPSSAEYLSNKVQCSDLQTPVVLPLKEGEQVCLKLSYNLDKEAQNKTSEAFSRRMVRQVTFSVDALNLTSNSQEAVPDQTKKKALVPLVIVFGDTRWEASAGAFFSSLAIRSFAVSPVFNSSAVVTDKQITTNILHPTVVPFAAVNYRISNDLSWSRWRMAAYLTGAVGVNPNTVSADFAAGPSLSFRGLLFSPLWHYGHDTRLTQGLKVGESLGPSYNGTVTSETFWTSSFAIGISVRVPSLTGR